MLQQVIVCTVLWAIYVSYRTIWSGPRYQHLSTSKKVVFSVGMVCAILGLWAAFAVVIYTVKRNGLSWSRASKGRKKVRIPRY
ncbi:hypothetical protein ASPWEDRAFT_44819 [Aspergillus wentii DTO 134E9]|uniref:Uncharacterized protein n=1 Tax=Aspergillus wentii DTO 134E9 TaxID=1073089 RepID=A0A1L9R7E8_ASPWE|nr:uncharacterized protein ASPWEDRAFT_44819 [Aspergillus wentii DTO 134E9]KAI9927464.1 hypothetical protein MW887_003078 [Aspergillus wentii]OJJ30840.1 hypothetical protein ASPWEDRAFT_44819 [Aspergillus wentii DTO 134E9]